MLRADRTQPFGFIREFATRWDVLAFIVVMAVVPFWRRPVAACLRRSRSSRPCRCRWTPSHLPEYAARTTFRMLAALVLSLVFTLTYATWAAKSERAGKLAGAHPGHSAVGADPGFHFHHRACSSCRWRPGACSARNSRRFSRYSPVRPGTWRSASTSRCAPCRLELVEAAESFRLSPWMRFWQLEVPFAHAGAHLEHDDVHVGRLVLRGGLRVDQRRPHHGGAARRRLLHRARHRAEESARHRLGDPHHADRDPAVRPAAVPAAGRLGGPLPGGAGARRAGAGFLGAHHDAPLAPHPAATLAFHAAVLLDQPRRQAHRQASWSRSDRPQAAQPRSAVGVADRGGGRGGPWHIVARA